jgi:hypothetical protein
METPTSGLAFVAVFPVFLPKLGAALTGAAFFLRGCRIASARQMD